MIGHQLIWRYFESRRSTIPNHCATRSTGSLEQPPRIGARAFKGRPESVLGTRHSRFSLDNVFRRPSSGGTLSLIPLNPGQLLADRELTTGRLRSSLPLAQSEDFLHRVQRRLHEVVERSWSAYWHGGRVLLWVGTGRV